MSNITMYTLASKKKKKQIPPRLTGLKCLIQRPLLTCRYTLDPHISTYMSEKSKIITLLFKCKVKGQPIRCKILPEIIGCFSVFAKRF